MATMMFRLALTLITILTVDQAVFAAVIYEQAYAYNDDQNGIISDGTGLFNQQGADNFVLSNAAAIESVTWYGYWGNSLPSSTSVGFNISFYSSTSSPPGVTTPALFSEVVTATLTASGPASQFGGTMYRMDASLSTPFNALANTDYWIGIWNTESVSSSPWQWAGFATSGLDLYARSIDGGNSWAAFSAGSGAGANGRNYAVFALSVPEPSAAALAGLAFILGACGLWRRKKQVGG